MSIHPSLRTGKSKGHKSVLKRLEKIFRLKKEGKWEENDPVLGLPKVKVTRLKIKKEKTKAAADATAEGQAQAAAPGAETAPAAAKQAAAKQEGAKKPAEKEKK